MFNRGNDRVPIYRLRRFDDGIMESPRIVKATRGHTRELNLKRYDMGYGDLKRVVVRSTCCANCGVKRLARGLRKRWSRCLSFAEACVLVMVSPPLCPARMAWNIWMVQ